MNSRTKLGKAAGGIALSVVALLLRRRPAPEPEPAAEPKSSPPAPASGLNPDRSLISLGVVD